jgi:primosomal protein N'
MSDTTRSHTVTKLRRCHWCGRQYDAAKESSVWCESNPHRGRGASRIPPRLFVMLLLPANYRTDTDRSTP